MIVIMDTSSLLSLVRYYLPFDKDLVLFHYIRQRIEEGEIRIIDAVLQECKYVSKGIVVETLGYLQDKSFGGKYKVPIHTEEMIAPAPTKFLRQVDNQFVVGVLKSKLSEIEYENQKDAFMKSADMKLIVYYLNLAAQEDLFNDVFIVTEEMPGANDKKLFKKLPAICEILGISVLTLPQLLTKYEGVDIHFK